MSGPTEILVMRDCTHCQNGWVRDERDPRAHQYGATVRCLVCNGSKRVQEKISVQELRTLLGIQ